jgi:hypothetical protein
LFFNQSKNQEFGVIVVDAVVKSNLKPTANLRSSSIKFTLLICLGIVIRLALAVGTYGTNDMLSWENFASEIKNSGISDLYRSDPLFNHPPLMGFLSFFLLSISELFGIPFFVVFKLVMVAAECGIMALLFRLWSKKSGVTAAWEVAALYSLNFITILLSGYHGNTDTLYCLAALAALIFVIENKPLYSGLALAAALNVKLIPLILAIPFILSLRSWRAIKLWLSGWMLGLLPFLVAAFMIGEPFIKNVLSYVPVPDNWGIIFILRCFIYMAPDLRSLFESAIGWYMSYGRWVILGLITAVSIWSRYSGRFSTPQLLSISAAIFIVFASGFGLQYLAFPAVMVFTIDPQWGLRISAATGVSAAITYANWMASLSPPLSMHYNIAPIGIALIYLIAWGFIVVFLIRTLTAPQQNTEVTES